MSLIWIICGAGRGLGKTTLALNLCEVLADSIYAKCGRSKHKQGKPGNFFTSISELEPFIENCKTLYKHIVIESNTLAVRRPVNNAIIIFIDGIAGKTSFRKDTEQLRSTADLKISGNSSPAEWEKVLATKLENQHKKLHRVVCDCLIGQQRYLFGCEPVVRSKVWFESLGMRVFGGGLAKLLENISHYGSLRDAAKAAKMSYRYAWNLIHAAEDRLGKTLVDRHAGGNHGGGSALSSDGWHVLNVFKQLNREVADFTDRRFTELYNGNKVNVKT